MKEMSRKVFNPKPLPREKVARSVVRFLGWIGIAVLFYVGFSIFFDSIHVC